jgi:UDP-GlcNAc:undecaprenyl-phosphate GlcNAc-1-phosphate transferase
MKLLGQAVAAAVTVWGGIRVLGFIDPVFQRYIELPVLIGGAVAFVWIILLMNAINFIDGLDGLAGGTALISSGGFFLVSLFTLEHSTGWAQGSLTLSAVLALVVSGSVAGFLLFNFHPARIFLGDSGSLFLGHMLASIALIGSLKSTAVFTTILPILIMGIPLADVLWAIVRRIREGQPISKADKGHVHHRLLDFGLSHRGVVLALYGFNLLLGSFAVWLSL